MTWVYRTARWRRRTADTRRSVRSGNGGTSRRSSTDTRRPITSKASSAAGRQTAASWHSEGMSLAGGGSALMPPVADAWNGARMRDGAAGPQPVGAAPRPGRPNASARQRGARLVDTVIETYDRAWNASDPAPAPSRGCVDRRLRVDRASRTLRRASGHLRADQRLLGAVSGRQGRRHRDGTPG